MYAYVQVASVGKPYCESAQDTVKLMKEVGIEAIANDGKLVDRSVLLVVLSD